MREVRIEAERAVCGTEIVGVVGSFGDDEQFGGVVRPCDGAHVSGCIGGGELGGEDVVEKQAGAVGFVAYPVARPVTRMV